ncbi:hypothetical protein MPUL_19760 [Mycolicibacterium pulveris]|uniref:Uncharacterized protein n=1 Tax=Mycolicibacterium pulveris TaxID=36813 RepID=A0A7I7UH37_MYCPV|nr:hypothetical protein [Mycolicibacterium pulveris]BBY80818.1 hypothetical protein MPUL_19760 [Mycolicibacterium pulveris]
MNILIFRTLEEVPVKPTAASAAQTSRQIRSRRDRSRAAPPKLLVLAPDTADVVSAAGGLVADALRVGWRVEVYLETMGDTRALQILGVEAHILPQSFDFGPEWPAAIAFAAVMYERPQGVRRAVNDATRRHGVDVAAWGGSWPSAPASASDVQHRLSSAARAFKYHAMKAIGTAATSSVETFHGNFRSLTAAISALPS